jgi:hypothetical protein
MASVALAALRDSFSNFKDSTTVYKSGTLRKWCFLAFF